MRWLFVALVALFVVPAKADTVTVTFRGVIAPYVWTGDRYVTGNPLAGQSFSTVWTLEACAGCSSGQIVSILLTIGGQAIPYAPGIFMTTAISPNGIYLNDTVSPGAIALNSFVTVRSALFPAAITTPFTYQTVADDNFDSPFHLGGSFWSDGPDGYLQMASLTVDNPSYVGEPFFVPAPLVGTGLPALVILIAGSMLCRHRMSIGCCHRT